MKKSKDIHKVIKDYYNIKDMEKDNFIVKNLNIHPTAKIGKNVTIECNTFVLGANSIIKDNCVIKCNNFIAHEGLYMCESLK